MKKIITLCCFLFLTSIMMAQVGIGTTTPRGALEISNSLNGGLIVPSYALSGNNDTTTVVNLNDVTDPLPVGTLIYNTTAITGTNAVAEGFVFWNGAAWTEVSAAATAGSGTQIMLRKFTASGIGGTGSVFNFPVESFNNITGASYSGTTLTLPTGVYEIESDLRLNSNNSIDWAIRLNGTEIANSIRGSAAPPRFNSFASGVSQVAMFEITAATGTIDFEVVGGSGATILPDQTYVKIKKVD